MEVYAAYTKNKEIRLKSSAGGVFWELASQTLSSGGVVFGAAWNESYEVDIVSVTNPLELPRIMTSKYVLSNVKNTYKECLNYLLDGKNVLYSALPCQIHGLKNFLKRDFDNLLCVDVCCHGTMPKNIWRDYLLSLKRQAPIRSINMRDKSNGWQNYQFVVEWSDGKILRQHHNDNWYMQTYLCDKYLREPCYNCKYKNGYSVADLIIGDFWGINASLFDNYDMGVNAVVINTKKGSSAFCSLSNIEKKPVDFESIKRYNNGFLNQINTKRSKYNPETLKPRVGIVTLHLLNNIGGVLQNYALQTAIKSFGLISYTIKLNDNSQWNIIPFTQKYIAIKEYKNIQSINKKDFDGIIIGSDQIWRSEWTSCDFSFGLFAKNWGVPIASYAASSGGNTLEYRPQSLNNLVLPMLKQMVLVGVREQSLQKYINLFTKMDVASVVCDPTMLLTAHDYLSLCESIETKHKKIGVYLLDKYNDNFLERIGSSKEDTYEPSDGDVLGFLAMFRDCDSIITDSFHGTVFSLIFNKPFICIKNSWRGAARFDTLISLFNIQQFFCNNIKDIKNVPNIQPNIDLNAMRQNGLNFLGRITDKIKENLYK